MPAAVPFLPTAISAVGSLLGKKKQAAASAQTPPFLSNPAFTKPMEGFGSALFPMAQQGFTKAFDYYGGVMNDPAAATASDAASVGKQTQQLTDRAARTMPRGGAQASVVSGLPQQQMAAGLERRQSATQNAAQNIGNLAGTAGGLGTNVFSSLLGNELGGKQVATGAGYLDLANRQFDYDKYSGIGKGIFDILSGKNSIGKDSPLGKIGDLIKGKWGRGGGGSASGSDPYGTPI